MNQFKNDLDDELQVFSLSDGKKHQIAKEIHKRKSKTIRGSNWSYRFALTAFIIFSISFGFLILQQRNTVGKLTTAANSDANLPVIHILASDGVKSIILIGIFCLIWFFTKRFLLKKGKHLPVCVGCGEEWSYKDALKISMKNDAVHCPHCGIKQYKTRKSSRKAGMLTFLIPLGILTAQIFNHIFLGYSIHVVGTIWLILTLTPYLIEFQEDDPMMKPLY